MSQHDEFDFSDQVFPEGMQTESSAQPELGVLTPRTEAYSAYMTANALLHLLLQKGILTPAEIKDTLKELQEDYMRKRGK